METLYKNKLHQLMHLLQIKCVNVVCEIQQLRLRRWKFILEQYYQLSIISFDHFIVFSNLF